MAPDGHEAGPTDAGDAAVYGIEKIPDTWVFNDFGHLTCYMFKDLNRNRRFDPAAEKIHGEFFHTTPESEAATALFRPVRLAPSHGCIHLKPLELDEMVRRKFMRKGARVVVHSYGEVLVPFPKGAASGPYELHIYPGGHKLVIVGTSK